MARTKPFLILFILSFSLTGHQFAQEKRTIDSVMAELKSAKEDTLKVMRLLDYGGLFAYTNSDTSEHYYRQAKDLTYKINFYHGKRKYITYQSEIYNLKGLFDSSIHLCREGLELAKQENDERFIGVHLNNIGNAFLYQGINDSAAHYLLQVPAYFEKTHEDKFLGILYSNLGVVFSNLDQPDQSIHYNRLSMQLAAATNDELGTGYAMINIGSELKKLKRYDSAIYYSTRSLEIARRQQDQSLEKDALVNLGYIHTSLNNFKAAQAYFEQSLELARQARNDYGIISVLKGMAEIQLKSKKFREAYKLLDEAFTLASKGGFKEEEQLIYLLQYQTDLAAGKDKEALTHYRLYSELKDSLGSADLKKSISALEKRYEAERRERLILQKDVQIKEQGSELRAKNNWIIILTSSLALLGLIGFLIWKYYRQKQLAALKEKEMQQLQISVKAREEERNRIARELHDDLGATLSGIGMYTHLIKSKVNKESPSVIESMVNTIEQSASEMVSKLSDIVWVVNPGEDSIGKLIQRVEEFALDMANARSMELKLNTKIAEKDLKLDMRARKNIYLICKEAINNSVKYSQASKLDFSATSIDHMVEVAIKDNGIGYDMANIKRGNGLNNIEARAREIGAEYYVGGEPGKGSRVELRYKIPQ